MGLPCGFLSCLYQGLLLRDLGCSLLPPPAYTIPKDVVEEGAEIKVDGKAQHTTDPLWGLILALEVCQRELALLLETPNLS